MRAASCARSIAAVCSLVLLAGPSSALASPAVPANAVIEAVAFEGISMAEHRTILDRIGVRVGDRLGAQARQRIGRRLNVLGDARDFSYPNGGLTFSDRPGSKPGTVVLVISAGC